MVGDLIADRGRRDLRLRATTITAEASGPVHIQRHVSEATTRLELAVAEESAGHDDAAPNAAAQGQDDEVLVPATSTMGELSERGSRPVVHAGRGSSEARHQRLDQGEAREAGQLPGQIARAELWVDDAGQCDGDAP